MKYLVKLLITLNNVGMLAKLFLLAISSVRMKNALYTQNEKKRFLIYETLIKKVCLTTINDNINKVF